MNTLVAIFTIGCLGLLAQLLVAPCPVYSLPMYWIFLAVYVSLFIILLFIRRYFQRPWVLGLSLAVAFVGLNGGMLTSNLCLKDSNVLRPLAQNQITSLQQIVQRYIVETQTFPRNFEDVIQRYHVEVMDPWGIPIRLHTRAELQKADCLSYAVDSAGPDRNFDRTDDVRQSFSCTLNGRCSSSCDETILEK